MRAQEIAQADEVVIMDQELEKNIEVLWGKPLCATYSIKKIKY